MLIQQSKGRDSLKRKECEKGPETTLFVKLLNHVHLAKNFSLGLLLHSKMSIFFLALVGRRTISASFPFIISVWLRLHFGGKGAAFGFVLSSLRVFVGLWPCSFNIS